MLYSNIPQVMLIFWSVFRSIPQVMLYFRSVVSANKWCFISEVKLQHSSSMLHCQSVFAPLLLNVAMQVILYCRIVIAPFTLRCSIVEVLLQYSVSDVVLYFSVIAPLTLWCWLHSAIHCQLMLCCCCDIQQVFFSVSWFLIFGNSRPVPEAVKGTVSRDE